MAEDKVEVIDVDEEVVEEVPVVKQASLSECLAQLNASRKATQELKAAEEKALAEVRKKFTKS